MPRQISPRDLEEEPSRPEPRYVDDDELKSTKRPKWMYPRSPLQVRILLSVGRRYFNIKAEHSAVTQVEKWSLSLSGGLVTRYPLEWIETCCKWAEDKRQKGEWISLSSLLSLIQNEDRKTDFISKWQREHKVRLQKKDDE